MARIGGRGNFSIVGGTFANGGGKNCLCTMCLMATYLYHVIYGTELSIYVLQYNNI